MASDLNAGGPQAQTPPAPPTLPARWTLAQWLAWAMPACLGLAVALWLHLQPQSPQRALFIQLNHWAAAYPAPIWSFITLLGDTDILFLLLSPLLLVRRQALMAVIAAIPAGGLFSVLLKNGFDALRPGAVLDLAQFHLIGPHLSNNSFPSGHTITAFSAAAAVLAVWAGSQSGAARTGRPGAVQAVGGAGLAAPSTTKSANPPPAGWPAGVAWVVAIMVFGLACAVGFSRVAVGAHWPVDVLAGACGGWLAGLSGAWATRCWPALWQNPRNSHVLLVGLAGLGVWLAFRQNPYPLGTAAVWLALGCVAGTVGVQVWRARAPP